METHSLTTPTSQKQGQNLSEAEHSSNCQSPPSERAIGDSANGLVSEESTLYLADNRVQRVSSAIAIGPPRSVKGVLNDRMAESANHTGDQDSAKPEDGNCLTPPKKHLTNASTSARFNLEKDSNSKKHEQRIKTEVQDTKPDELVRDNQMHLGSPRPFCPTNTKKMILQNIEEVLGISIEDRYGMRSSIGNFEHRPGDFNRILDLETVDEVSSHTGFRDSIKSRSSALRSDDNLHEFDKFNRAKKLPSKLKKPADKDYCNPCTLI